MCLMADQVLYMFTWLDRGALGNAALMGIREDLGFSPKQFSLAVSMFFVGTCIADLFTNIGMRYIRPSLYLATAMVRFITEREGLFHFSCADEQLDHLGSLCNFTSGRRQSRWHVCH